VLDHQSYVSDRICLRQLLRNIYDDSHSLYNRFVALDHDILSSPISILRSQDPQHECHSQHQAVLPSPSPSLLSIGQLLKSGSCALTAIVDVESDRLYVANTGDCRAVAGWFDRNTNLWRCDVLSENQQCANPREADR
jgi:pyruvate dehydrogenase phosphatase